MTLKDFVKIKSGRTFKNGVNEHIEPTHAVIQLRDIDSENGGDIDWERLVNVKIETTRKVTCLSEGQILVVAKGPVKKAVAVFPPIENAVASQHFLIISLIEKLKLLPDFLCFYLNSAPAQNWLNSNAGGSYQSSLSITTLLKLPFPNVSILQQELILEGVNSANKEIALHEALIAERKSQLNDIAGKLLNK